MGYQEGYSLADIAAATGNNNDGFGNGSGAWLIILFLIFAAFGWGGNRGFGGFGGNSGGTSVYEGYVLNNDFSQLSKQISDSYSMTERKLDGLANGLCDGFYTNAQLINGVNTNILTATNGINTNISNLGFNLQDCCCKTQRAIDSVNFNMAQNTCAITNNATMNTRDIIDTVNANYRSLHDEIVANRIEDKNAQITAQQNEINALRLAASQEKQNAYLISELGNKCPVPAYLTCNPNAPLNYSISYGNSCGCNNGCGC